MDRLLLGVDVGTHETKGMLVDGRFRPVAEASLPHEIENPRPGYYEMDAGIWWDEFCRITKTLLQKAGAKSAQVAGVGVSVMGCDCIAVDGDCRPLRKAILYGIDARSAPQIERLRRELGDDGVTALFGHIPRSDDVATKILWIRETEPEVFARTHKFLTGSSYMAAKLTGNYTIDTYLAKAAFRPLYRQTDGAYDAVNGPAFCAAEQLAEPQDVTAPAGTVTEQAAAECGLLPGTPVITGTGDSTAESIAAGLLTPGTLFAQFGSTLFYIYCLPERMPACDADHFPGSNPFTIPGSFAAMGGTNCCGAMTAWVRDTFYQDAVAAQKAGGPSAWQVMAEEAAGVPAGSGGLVVLPYLYGERSPIHDPLARGVIFGLTGSHGRAAVCRAALEGTAYSLGSHLRLFAAHGLEPEEIVIAGGGTKNPLWMQITADVLGRPVKVAQSWQTACYGDACMAAVGCGLLKDFSALKAALPPAQTVRPDPERHGLYRKYQDIYEALYRQTSQLMHDLAGLA